MAARTTIKSALDPLLQATLYDRFAKQVAAVFIRNQNIAISCISALYVSNVLISFLEEWEVRALPAMNYVTLILQPLFDRIQAISRDYVDETDLCSRLLKLFQVLWRACSKQMLQWMCWTGPSVLSSDGQGRQCYPEPKRMRMYKRINLHRFYHGSCRWPIPMACLT